MARRIGRSWSKATNRSPWRSAAWAQAAARQPVARVAHQHHGLLAERQHLERPARRGVREDPEVGLVPQHRLDHLVGVEALEQDPRVGVHRHERLHVAAHVVEPDRVDRRHADGALHTLPRDVASSARARSKSARRVRQAS